MPSGQKKLPLSLDDFDIEANGVVLCGVKKPGRMIVKGIPTITIDVVEKIKGIPNVVGDCETVGKMAAEYFLSLGLKHFAFCGYSKIGWSIERRNAFKKKLKEAGHSVHIFNPPKSDAENLLEKERIILAKWLESLPKPIGIMACNDDRGHNIIEAATMAELKIPDEIAVLGVDNDKLVCELTKPPMSSIALNFEKAGYECAAMLDQMMAGKIPENQTIVIQPTHIKSRQSTDILAIEDPEIVEAIQFIRLNSQKLIQIDDVANAVMLSRRTLTKRFRKVVGHSVYKEIRQVRVNRISQMLVETNMSISQIALSMGYTSVDHISRVFKDKKGISPLEFRKDHGHF